MVGERKEERGRKEGRERKKEKEKERGRKQITNYISLHFLCLLLSVVMT